MKTLLSHSAWTIATSCVQAAGALALSILLARLLGPAGRGAYGLALLIILTSGFVANPCLYSSANYFLSTGQRPLDHIALPILALSSLCGLLAFGFATIGGDLLAGGAALLGRPTLLITGLGAGAFVIGTSMNGVLYGSRKVRSIAVWSMLASLIQLSAAALLSWWLRPSVILFVSVYVATLGLDAVVKIFLGIGSWRALTFHAADVSAVLRYGFSVFAGRLLNLLSQRLDTFLLYSFAGYIALGYYGLAVGLGEQLWLVPAAVSLVMMANLAHRPDAEAARLTASASQLVFALALLTCLGFALIMPFFIPILYGAAFQPSVAPLILLLPGIASISSYMMLEPFFQSRGKPLLPVGITFGGAAANLLACLLLIPRYGLLGAAIASSVSYVFQLGLACWAFAGVTGFSFWSPLAVHQTAGQAIRLLRARVAAAVER